MRKDGENGVRSLDLLSLVSKEAGAGHHLCSKTSEPAASSGVQRSNLAVSRSCSSEQTVNVGKKCGHGSLGRLASEKDFVSVKTSL